MEFTQECKRSLSAKYYGEQARKQVSGTHLDKFSNLATFQCWKTSFKTDECCCSPIRTRTERHRSCEVKLVARFVRMVGGFHRKSGGPRVSASRNTPVSTSHESDQTPSRKVESSKHNFFIHFPKDRNCEVSKRTKITRAPCRRRTGETALRAVTFGDLITADHKVLNEGCESRNTHRQSVVIQDSATRWIQ